MKNRKKIVLLGAALFNIYTLGAKDYNIVNYGAIADSSVVNTEAINRTINVCASNGGGKVLVPAGDFKTGTIVLKSNVELHLSSGASLYASEDYTDFPIFPQTEYRSLKDAGGWSALIYAVNAENISITGQGTIDGRGQGRKGRVAGVAGDCNGRPRNLLFISCRNLHIEGITMRHAAIWNQHYLDCEDVTIDHIRVYNHGNGNNDGIDIDGCRRFILTNSIIDSDDDGIVLKSTGIAPCEDILINNCIVSSYANAIKCGTESTGGFKRISISDCIIKPSRHKGERVIKSTPSGITAISLEIVDGGIMDRVTIDNILIEGTECPLYVRLGNRGRKHIPSAPQPEIGVMKNIRISNITAYATGNFCSSITGIPGGKIEDISLSNFYIVNKGGLTEGNFLTKELIEGKRHDTGGNMYPDKYWESMDDVSEDENGYPQPTIWRNLPSYALFLRHIKNVSIQNTIFRSESKEPRTPIIADDVESLILQGIQAESVKEHVWMRSVKRHMADSELKIKHIE